MPAKDYAYRFGAAEQMLRNIRTIAKHPSFIRDGGDTLGTIVKEIDRYLATLAEMGEEKPQ